MNQTLLSVIADDPAAFIPRVVRWGRCCDIDPVGPGVAVDISRLPSAQSSTSPERGGLLQLRKRGLCRRTLHVVSVLVSGVHYG